MSRTYPRNNKLYDWWSLVHFLTGVVFGLFINPFLALLLMALWEPLENFVLSPLLDRININFGYESLRNALSDIVFDALGILAGFILLQIIT